MRTKLKPFDLDAVCAKCGSTDISARYEKNAHHHGECALGIVLSPDCCVVEHIERYCRVCSFRWAESPLDQPAQPPQEEQG